MVKLSKNNCGQELTLEQLRETQLDMLKVVAKFCEEHGLRYYLSGGSLLGAIRHKGFIPWDDDIDINMPRSDCEKLLKLSNGKLGKYYLQEPSWKSLYHSESYRMYDTSIVIESSIGGTSKKKIYMPSFIDIFPIEGLPESQEETKKMYRKIVICRKMMNCMTGSLWHGKTFKAKVFHLVGRPIATLIGYDYFYNTIQKIVTTYRFEDCKYVGVMTAHVHTLEEKVLKAEYEPQIDVDFEDFTAKGPMGYDVYLTQLYGKNYMELPPIEKRKSHHGFKIYVYKEN